MQNELNDANRVAKGCRYSDEVKQFILTLHYYSPRAYKYCRSILRLPRASSLRNWLLSVDSQPGFLRTVLDMVSKQGKRDFSLVLDSMAIRKRSHFNTHQGVFEGFCNYGGIVGEESNTLATEALVFLLVALKSGTQYLSRTFWWTRSPLECRHSWSGQRFT